MIAHLKIKYLVVALCLLNFVLLAIFYQSPGGGGGQRDLPLPDASTDNQYETPTLKALSLKPRLSVYHNILTPEECNHIIDLGKDSLQDSGVNNIEGVLLSNKQMEDPVLVALSNKIAELTQLPVANGENYYLWKYKKGDFYPPHRDCIKHPQIIRDAGDRIASVFVYLNTPEGGDIEFLAASPTLLSFKPQQGTALFLWNLLPNGEEDLTATHTTTPLNSGLKWTLTKWIRERKFQP